MNNKKSWTVWLDGEGHNIKASNARSAQWEVAKKYNRSFADTSIDGDWDSLYNPDSEFYKFGANLLILLVASVAQLLLKISWFTIRWSTVATIYLTRETTKFVWMLIKIAIIVIIGAVDIFLTFAGMVAKFTGSTTYSLGESISKLELRIRKRFQILLENKWISRHYMSNTIDSD